MTFAALLVICWILFAHWVGDFVLQTDEMARGKSKSNYWLTQHVAVYTSTLASAILLTSFLFTPWLALAWVFLNGAIHWAVDYVTSRRNARLWKEGRVHDFFTSVGFDQFIHFVTLAATSYWLFT